MQTQHPDHIATAQKRNAQFALHNISDRDIRKMFKLFYDSKDRSNHENTIKQMRRLFLRQPKNKKVEILFTTVHILLRNTPTEMLHLPTCPLKIYFPILDANVLSSSDGSGSTALHWLAESSDPSDEMINKNQVVLGKLLIKAGANVNARAARFMGRITPLHRACQSGVPTNLDFIKLLLKKGADPNAKSLKDETPLHHTMHASPAAAKFLLEHASDRIDTDIVTKRGFTFLHQVRRGIEDIQYKAAHPAQTDAAGLMHLVGQLQELESILVARGAVDIGNLPRFFLPTKK